MPQAETNADVLRRLVLLQRIPVFSALTAGVLYGLAERGRDGIVSAGEVVASDPDRLVFFPSGVQVLGGEPVLDALDVHAPHLARLGGTSGLLDVTARADGAYVEIPTAAFLDALDDEFSLFLAVASSLATGIVEAARSRGSSSFGDAACGWLPGRSTHPLDLMERVQALQAALPFGASRVLSLVQLARQSAELRADGDLELWHKDDLATRAVIPVHGCIRSNVDGRPGFVLAPGSVLPFVDVLANGRRWFTATASGPLLAFSLPVERLLDVLEDQPELARELLEALASERARLR